MHTAQRDREPKSLIQKVTFTDPSIPEVVNLTTFMETFPTPGSNCRVGLEANQKFFVRQGINRFWKKSFPPEGEQIRMFHGRWCWWFCW